MIGYASIMESSVAKLSLLQIKLRKAFNLLKDLEVLVGFLGIKSILMILWITIKKMSEEMILILMKISSD